MLLAMDENTFYSPGKPKTLQLACRVFSLMLTAGDLNALMLGDGLFHDAGLKQYFQDISICAVGWLATDRAPFRGTKRETVPVFFVVSMSSPEISATEELVASSLDSRVLARLVTCSSIAQIGRQGSMFIWMQCVDTAS
jgi:hypothetical protein